MGLPSYIVNFDELIDLMAVKGVNIEIDTTGIEDTLNTSFPEVLRLLEGLCGQQVKGIQKIKGFVTTGSEITFIPDEDIFITGISFSQNVFDANCLDKWNIKVRNGGDESIMFNSVYSKDTLQHKYFEQHYPVPAGYEIVIEPVNHSGADKTYWIDLEYIGDVENS